MIFDRYEASLVEDHVILVTKTSGPPWRRRKMTRLCEWDGFWFGDHYKRPDFVWLRRDGRRSNEKLRFRARWACLRALREKSRSAVPDWHELKELPEAKLLKEGR